MVSEAELDATALELARDFARGAVVAQQMRLMRLLAAWRRDVKTEPFAPSLDVGTMHYRWSVPHRMSRLTTHPAGW
ncbi:hypothetical protein AB0383_34580 [Amycolatopsis sp. NPDC051373]|uniref:hypothetical protein n=1 Tax=Amycolatopsis sp. NPDC051373 TaxID=3155801 RepID=UPI00344EE0F0